jgi:DNA-binding MarR family transcriptional regulator
MEMTSSAIPLVSPLSAGARRVGVTPGEVSRAMHELRDAGLVESTGGEGGAEELWRPTPLGERVAEELALDADTDRMVTPPARETTR